MPNLNKTSFERLIEFVKVDLTPFGGDVYRYANTSTYEADIPELSNITWQGEQWLAIPFQTGGFARGGENLVRPAIQVADFTGELFVMLESYDFAPGAPVSVYYALADDVENNVPNALFQQHDYVLNKVAREQMVLELELAIHMDFAMTKVPGYVITREDAPGLGSALLRG